MDGRSPRAARVWALVAVTAGLVAVCDQSDAPDDVTRHPRVAEVARILPPDQALAGAHVPTLDPAWMNDAEIRQAVGTRPQCWFRYARTGKPVLAMSVRPDGTPDGGVVKLNGSLIVLEAAASGDSGQPRDLALAAAPIRLTVTPAPAAAQDGDAPRREATMVFEVAESLRVGYRGFFACTPEPPMETSRR